MTELQGGTRNKTEDQTKNKRLGLKIKFLNFPINMESYLFLCSQCFES